jgi:hypothetical protein
MNPSASSTTVDAFALRLVLAELNDDRDACQIVLDEICSNRPDLIGRILGYLTCTNARLLEKHFGANDAIDLITSELAALLSEKRRDE